MHKRRRVAAASAPTVEPLADCTMPVEQIPAVTPEQLLNILLNMVATETGGALKLMWMSPRVKDYQEAHDIALPRSPVSMQLVREHYLAVRDLPDTGAVTIHALDGILPCDFVLHALVSGPPALREMGRQYTERHYACFQAQLEQELFSEEGAALLKCLSVVMGQRLLKEEVRQALYTSVVASCSFFVRSDRIPGRVWGSPWMPKLCAAICAGLRTDSGGFWQESNRLLGVPPSTRGAASDVSWVVPRFVLLSTLFCVSDREQEGLEALAALRAEFETNWQYGGRWMEMMYRSARDNPLLPMSARLWLSMFGKETMMTQGFVLSSFDPDSILEHVALAAEMKVRPTFHLDGSYGDAVDVQVVSRACREVPRFGVSTAMQADRGVYVRRLAELLRFAFKIHAKVSSRILPADVLQHFVSGRRMAPTDGMRGEVLERLGGGALPLPDMPRFGASGAVFQPEAVVGKFMEVRAEGWVRVLDSLTDAVSSDAPWEAVQWVHGSAPLLRRFVARVARADEDTVTLETGNAFHAPRTCVTLTTEAQRAAYVEQVCAEYCRLADVLIATAFDCALPMPRPITAETVAAALFDGEAPDVQLDFRAGGVPPRMRAALLAYLERGGRRAQTLLRDFAFGDRKWDGPSVRTIQVRLLPRERMDLPPPPPRARMCFGQLYLPRGHWTDAAMAAYLDHFLPQGTAGGFSEMY